MRNHLATSVVLIALGYVPHPVLPAARGVTAGVISGVVVDEHQQPVSRAQVSAFSVRAAVPQEQPRQTVPFSMRADGSATTDDEGRFQIYGLDLDDYLVAAEPLPSLSVGAPKLTPLYATTFYPSTLDGRGALRVPASAGRADPIRIQLVQVRGARVAGSVVSPSGRPVAGMDVRLFYRFGGFGSGSNVAVVNADGTFEIPRVPPGWYRLTIAWREAARDADRGEFASRLIEVGDTDIDGLVLALGAGASISGRVVAGTQAGVQSAIGLRVSASTTDEAYAPPPPGISATVASDWSFRMTGLSGSYQWTVNADRPPFVKATRVTVDGVETASGTEVELTEGSHEVVVFVSRREPPAPTFDKTLSTSALVETFKNEKVFWRQMTIGEEIVKRHDASVLPSLVDWLSHEDRHIRANVGFIFGGLGDARGLQVITDVLGDRSDRPEEQGSSVSGDGRYHVELQIRADRYYAAHVLGDLRDPRGVPILVDLLQDKEVSSIVPWALGQIGDKSAVRPNRCA